ncbi:preprotein translocase subunit YajC [Streptococcus sp. zg-JUN1979]|uniref:preprotein translocase subunit YajC n=1 Tax=Streptococcus sp. zg-JUN1979 TaxID=3391450 RepID=UPI0039A5320A
MPAIIMLVLMFAMIWFMQRNQKKQAQQRQEQLDAIKPGDDIVTIGGLYGKIDEIDRDAQKMVLDVEGVYLTFELSAIKRVLSKDSAPAITTISEPEAAKSDDSSSEEAVSADDTQDTAIKSED